jgi:RHS repeat-associated protein
MSNPFGDGLSCTGGPDATEQHFTGKDRDAESGLDYFYARYYTSDLGRFMTPDWSGKPAAVLLVNVVLVNNILRSRPGGSLRSPLSSFYRTLRT